MLHDSGLLRPPRCLIEWVIRDIPNVLKRLLQVLYKNIMNRNFGEVMRLTDAVDVRQNKVMVTIQIDQHLIQQLLSAKQQMARNGQYFSVSKVCEVALRKVLDADLQDRSQRDSILPLHCGDQVTWLQ